MTRDGGATIENVTPDGLPESIINVVEPSPHDPAKAYFAAAGYKMNDFTPYLFRTNDYGQSWEKIVDGIPGNTFARSIREDPDREGLLYAGTENGLFVSFDDGDNWQPFQLNLPQVPITDLRIRQQDLDGRDAGSLALDPRRSDAAPSDRRRRRVGRRPPL